MEIKSEIKPIMKRTIYILPCRGAFIQLKKMNYLLKGEGNPNYIF